MKEADAPMARSTVFETRGAPQGPAVPTWLKATTDTFLAIAWPKFWTHTNRVMDPPHRGIVGGSNTDAVSDSAAGV